MGCGSKIKKRMANSIDPDEMAHYEPSGSTLFAQVSGLVCRAEKIKLTAADKVIG